MFGLYNPNARFIGGNKNCNILIVMAKLGNAEISACDLLFRRDAIDI